MKVRGSQYHSREACPDLIRERESNPQGTRIPFVFASHSPQAKAWQSPQLEPTTPVVFPRRRSRRGNLEGHGVAGLVPTFNGRNPTDPSVSLRRVLLFLFIDRKLASDIHSLSFYFPVFASLTTMAWSSAWSAFVLATILP